MRERVPVFRNQPWRRALACAERLRADLPGARITDVPPPEAVCELRRRAVGDAVSFADRELERA